MGEPLDQLQATLKAQKLSVTKPRQLVFAKLLGQEPLSMHELYALCRHDLDRASLYRTVALFERLGIVQRLHIGWKYKLELSNAFQHHHHHMACRACGTVFPLPEDAALEQRLQQLATLQGFNAEDHQIEVSGLCSGCRQS